MKIGDLVKHPHGISNVCKDTYSFGLILESRLVGHPDNQVMQHLVWWCGDHGPMQYLHGPMQYLEGSLEVINASR